MELPFNPYAGLKPLDHPNSMRPHRIYIAMTNKCNRNCPWCSTCSSPKGSIFIAINDLLKVIPNDGDFEAQLEGGEPTVHPNFWEIVRVIRENPRCRRLVLGTNGVLLPRSESGLEQFIQKLGVPLTIKLSINHYLIDHDPGLISLAQQLVNIMNKNKNERQLVINVRLRKGYDDNDSHIQKEVDEAGLLPYSNVFFLQRYGFAVSEIGWEPPMIVWDAFTLISPDGTAFGQDLIGRAEHMRRLS